MGNRPNIYSLSSTELQRFHRVLDTLKRDGRYNRKTEFHARPSMSLHKEPGFLPKHRVMLLELEEDMRSVDSRVVLPYWDAVADQARGAPRSARLFTDQYIGPSGDSSRGYRVRSGPYAAWTMRLYSTSSGSFRNDTTVGLTRWVGRDSPLPTRSMVDNAMATEAFYVPPYNASGAGAGRMIEEIHNIVHRCVGGIMLSGTSPNDPCFWLHHCNVDRLWWDWQVRWAQQYGGISNTYLPITGGPAGTNIDDVLSFARVPRSIRGVLDNTALGVRYIV